jgi:hypothetical protein
MHPFAIVYSFRLSNLSCGFEALLFLHPTDSTRARVLMQSFTRAIPFRDSWRHATHRPRVMR